MSKMSDFLAKQSGVTAEQKPPSMILDVAAMCQHCMEQVEEAEYFPNEAILTWICSEGHRSYIEEFRL